MQYRVERFSLGVFREKGVGFDSEITLCSRQVFIRLAAGLFCPYPCPLTGHRFEIKFFLPPSNLAKVFLPRHGCKKGN
jgi:hypothetical protein